MKTMIGLSVALAAVQAFSAPSREEIRRWFLENEYGVRPESCKTAKVSFKEVEKPSEAFGGKAVKKHAWCTVSGPEGEYGFDIFAYLPKVAKPVPSFVFMCNRRTGVEAGLEGIMKTGFWPAERIVERGYGAVLYYNSDVAFDSYTGFDAYTNGIFRVMEKRGERTASSWGMLSAWAYGASKVMDWIEREPTLDRTKVAIVGHSRCGKTALLTGIEDPRFAMICSNNSGCGGAKSNRMDLPRSEPNWKFKWWGVSYWFCEKFQEAIVGHEKELPYDQDEFIKLLSDKIVCVRSGQADEWAGPEGECASALSAASAWWREGHPERFDYSMREGDHGLMVGCWNHYMDVADANWRGKTVVVSGGDSAALQRALDTSARPLTVVIGKGDYAIQNSLKVSSGTHVIAHPEVRIRSVGRNLLVNADQQKGNCDIRIEGGVWDGCAMKFSKVKNLKVNDLKLANAAQNFLELNEVREFEIRRIRLASTLTSDNADGVRIASGCADGVVDGVQVETRGKPNGDLIVVASVEAISNLVVRHVFAEDAHGFVRMSVAGKGISKVVVEDSATGVRKQAFDFGGTLDGVVVRRCSYWSSWAEGIPCTQSTEPLVRIGGACSEKAIRFEDVYRDMRLDQDRKRPTCGNDLTKQIYWTSE